MRQPITIALAALMTATFANAQRLPPKKSSGPVKITTTQTTGDPSIAMARRIKREEAIRLVREGKAIYVDVRSRATYDKGHIKGAFSIPNSQMLSRVREIPPGKLAITYCACVAEHTAAVAVVNLRSVGFKNAAALLGGWDEWVALGLPTEKTR